MTLESKGRVVITHMDRTDHTVSYPMFSESEFQIGFRSSMSGYIVHLANRNFYYSTSRGIQGHNRHLISACALTDAHTSVMHMDGSHGFHELTGDESTWLPAGRDCTSRVISDTAELFETLDIIF